MDVFIKATAGVLVALILYIVLDKQGRDISAVLTVCVCCMVVAAGVTFLEPVIGLLRHLQNIAELDQEMIRILLKAVGIGLLGEITALICTDGGNAAMGKTVQLLATSVILWLSVPLFTALIELVETILVNA